MAATTQTRRRLHPDARRDLIERAALRLFARDGYAATRLDDVASDAGVTKPMVYRHFASKKDLYLALLRRHEEDLPGFITGSRGRGSDIRAQLEPSGPPVGVERPSPSRAVETTLDGWLDYVEENSDSWLVIFRDRTGDAEIERARRRVSQRATEVLAGFLVASQPDLDPDLVEPTADFLRSGLAGLVLWWIDHPRVSRETVHATATRACAAVLGR
jgi:AcrR family transcriptional regulator